MRESISIEFPARVEHELQQINQDLNQLIGMVKHFNDFPQLSWVSNFFFPFPFSPVATYNKHDVTEVMNSESIIIPHLDNQRYNLFGFIMNTNVNVTMTA